MFSGAVRKLGRWSLLGCAVGVLCGAASALFLWLLELATDFRSGHGAIIFLLPVAGAALGWLQQRHGQAIRGGNNLVIDTLHEGGPGLPKRMAPMVLAGTVLTHLFGGSAGREGTAVQMGAGLADWVSHRLRLGPELRLQLLTAGVAGGFGSVFGTPWAGAIFSLEFVVVGRIRHGAWVPALIASVVGDMTTRALGMGHTPYPTVPSLSISLPLLGKWLLFALAIAAVAVAFIELTHRIRQVCEKRLGHLAVRMFFGGLAVVALWRWVGNDTHLGLGVPTILRAFEAPAVGPELFALKLLFTAITLGTGFLGGEVTPLFFIGATLGSVLAQALGIPLAMGAGVGMAAVFAAASNTPLAMSVMAVELLGIGVLPHVLIVCVAAFLLTGHRSIYPAQRLGRAKWGPGGPPLRRLQELPAARAMTADRSK